MTPRLESSIEGTCRDDAAKAGALLVKLHHGITGFPDRLLVRPGRRMVFIEFKRPREPPTKIQLYWHRVLRSMGQKVYLLDNIPAFRKLLTSST